MPSSRGSPEEILWDSDTPTGSTCGKGPPCSYLVELAFLEVTGLGVQL